jgi:cytochrome c
MKTILITAALAAAFGMAPALASETLAKTKQCFACHAVDKELSGPSFKAIAKLHKGTPGAEAKLTDKIMKGGAEHWGDKVMPPAEARGIKTSEADAKRLAKWVLRQ